MMPHGSRRLVLHRSLHVGSLPMGMGRFCAASARQRSCLYGALAALIIGVGIAGYAPVASAGIGGGGPSNPNEGRGQVGGWQSRSGHERGHLNRWRDSLTAGQRRSLGGAVQPGNGNSQRSGSGPSSRSDGDERSRY